jgi:hypothetical protein
MATLSTIFGIFVSIIARPVMQLLWGKENLRVYFECIKLEKIFMMKCFIANLPIRNKILRMLRVKTEGIESLNIQFSILNPANHQEITKPIRAESKIELLSSYEPISIPIVEYDPKLEKCLVMDSSKQQAFTLLRGIYLAKVSLFYEHEEKIFTKLFIVDSNNPFIRIDDKNLRLNEAFKYGKHKL